MTHEHSHNHGSPPPSGSVDAQGHNPSHSHRHDHSQGHDQHGHGTGDAGRLKWAFGLTFVFMIAEAVGGVVSGSLALLADAGHMLTDAGALALALAGLRLAARPSDKKRSYGYARAQVLAAFVNGLTLIAIAVWIVIEAIGRIANPPTILPWPMLVIAVLGLVVNLVVFRILHGGDKENLNLRGAILHVIGDILGSIAAIAASLVIFATGWTPIDPILSVLVALLIAFSAGSLLRRSGHILLEGTPPSVDVDRLRRDLLDTVAGVEDIHHLHVWLLTEKQPLVTFHARIKPGTNNDTVLAALQTVLADKYGFDHTTIQLEHDLCSTDHTSGHDHV